jgi:hypothetical protein
MNIQNLILKYRSGTQLSEEEIEFLFKKILPIFNRTIVRTTFPIDAQKRIVEAILNQEVSPKDKNELLYTIIKELIPNVVHIPFNQKNPESDAYIIYQKMKKTGVVQNQYMSSIQLLMKLYNYHDKKILKFNPQVILNEHLTMCIRISLSDHSKYVDLSLTDMTHMMFTHKLRLFPQLEQLVDFERCDNCKIFRGFMILDFNTLVEHVAEHGFYCECWKIFVQHNQTRTIPCSVGGCKGPRCDFCEKYIQMQLTEMIAVLNSFKNGSLISSSIYGTFFKIACSVIVGEDVISFSPAIYDELFIEMRKIIAGGCSMPFIPFVLKLDRHRQALGQEIFERFLKLSEKLEKFMKENRCAENPEFLSIDLSSFTEDTYHEYMDNLRREQEEFQDCIPELGFCCCSEIIAKEKHQEFLKNRDDVIKIKQEDEERLKQKMRLWRIN